MKLTGFLILFVVLYAVTAFAQTYNVGDKVEFQCPDCFGRSGWTPGTIEKMSGDTFQIRYGTEPRQFRTEIKQIFIRESDFAAKQDVRKQFFNEASIYRESVYGLMQIHNPNLRTGSGYYLPPTNAADWTKLMNNLATVDNLCKTKYPGMTNGKPNNDTDLSQLPATWCEIAARRTEYQAKGRQMGAAGDASVGLKLFAAKIQEAINGGYNGFIDEDVQLFVYEREKWRATQAAKYEKGFKDLGVPVPADFYKDIETKANEFKAANERIAPTRSFLMPKHKDATVESFIRGRYATEKKGVQILKIGLDDANWVIHRNNLGIPTSQTKVARLLVKVPNRPFCQEHSIAAERKYQGGKYGALSVDGGKVGAEGAFMRCE
ncbi:MAG TPA: hypothetical protein PKY82_32080 [Pyrinomonadaceae bacterium]|nr:hypothetical protein [Pyrinomonadaceae bacterium]